MAFSRRKLASLLFLVALLLSAAAPVSSEELINGEIKLRRDGQIFFREKSVTQIKLSAWPPAKWQSKQFTINKHRILHLAIAVDLKNRRQYELVAQIDDNQTPEIIWQGATGLQGPDAEWQRFLRVDERGILLYQARDGIKRCDGEPTYLFPKLWDFGRRQFRSAIFLASSLSKAGAPDSFPTLVAKRRTTAPLPTVPPINSFRLTAASTQAGDNGLASNLLAPQEAEDNKLTTVWSEDLGGFGRGEFLCAAASNSFYPLQAIKIVPGDSRSLEKFRQANRLKSLLLLLSAKERYRIMFPNDPLSDSKGTFSDEYWVMLPRPSATRCASLVIEDVYPGKLAQINKDGGQTAIAEIHFYSQLEFSDSLTLLLKDLASNDERRAQAAVESFSRWGVAGHAVLLPKLSTISSRSLHRLLPVLLKQHSSELLSALLKALPRLEEERDRQMFWSELSSWEALALPALRPLLIDETSPYRQAAANFLGRYGDASDVVRLCSFLGDKDQTIREGAVKGLVEGFNIPSPNSEKVEAILAEFSRIDFQTAAAKTADYIFILERIGASSTKENRERIIQILSSRELQNSKSFEIRYRLISAFSTLAVSGQKNFFNLAAQDEDPALRLAVYSQVPSFKELQEFSLLKRGLADADPGVRTQTIKNLARLDLRYQKQLFPELEKILAYDEWGIVAREAAATIGRNSDPAATLALKRALSRARGDVDLAALTALFQDKTKYPMAELLLTVAENKNFRLNLRKLSLAYLSSIIKPGYVERLAKLFYMQATDAVVEPNAEVLSQSALTALAQQINHPAVRPAFEIALAPDSPESLRLSAAVLIGQRCPTQQVPSWQSLLLKINSDDESELVRRALQDSQKKCQRLFRVWQ